MPITGGTSVLNTVATSPTGATAHDRRAIVSNFIAGTQLLDVSDPSDDDNGPGTFQYPTSGDFVPGAFDIQRFQVFDSGTDVVLRLTRDLTPTFGSPLGAQLVDVYVHVPGASPSSTAASNATRNFTIAPADAWSRMIQVQGFASGFEDATGDGARHAVGRREQRLADDHDHGPEVGARSAGGRLGLQRRPHRPGRLQHHRSGTRLRRDAAAFPVRGLRAGRHDPDLRGRPGDRAEGDGRHHAVGRAQATELDPTLGPVVLHGVAIP